MSRVLKTLRAVQWSMLGSILLCVIVGEVLGPRARAVDSSLSYIFSTLAVGVVGVIFVIRRTLVLRAGASLAAHPDDLLSLNQWKTGLRRDLCPVRGFGVIRPGFALPWMHV